MAQRLRARLAAQPALRRASALVSGERATDPVLLALAAAVGLGTGLLAVALIEVIARVQGLAFGASLPDAVAVLVMPAAGGLVVGVILHRWVPEAGGSGGSQVMTAIALHGGRMRGLVAIVKVLTAGIGLGTGSSGGRESPIVHIGGVVGSVAGRLTALTDDQRRALIAAGAGGGIAASFNAPIAGMLFALEVIMGGFRARSLQVVVIACVVASVVAREIVGDALTYNPPPFRLSGLGDLGLAGVIGEFALYGLLGLAAVAVGIAFIRGELAIHRVSERLPLWPPLRVALGGLAVGAIALAVPEVLGTGDHLPPVLGVTREPMAEMLSGTFGGSGRDAVVAALVLLLAKLVATSTSLGSGSTVGSFGPALFMGAALGSAFGHLAAELLPTGGVQPGAFALVGAAAALGATYRAPLTAILIAFELTGDYGLVLPLMFATGIATFLADRVQPGSIATLPLLRRGIVYGEPDQVDIMQTVRVGEVMTTQPATVPADLPLAELAERFHRSGHHGFPVVEPGSDPQRPRLVGMVTRSDLATRGGDDHARAAGDICTRRLVTVVPSDPMYRALRRMAAIDVGRLPVVAADDHGALVGLVRRADVVTAYQRAVTRSLGVQQRREASRLRDLAGAQFVDLVVDADAPVAGRAVRDVEWPPRTVLTSVRRSGDLVLPNGDTVLQPGDEVVVLTGVDTADAVRELIGGGAGSVTPGG